MKTGTSDACRTQLHCPNGRFQTHTSVESNEVCAPWPRLKLSARAQLLWLQGYYPQNRRGAQPGVQWRELQLAVIINTNVLGMQNQLSKKKTQASWGQRTKSPEHAWNRAGTSRNPNRKLQEGLQEICCLLRAEHMEPSRTAVLKVGS